MDGLVSFVGRELQLAAFGFAVLMVILRVRWFLGFPAEAERQAPGSAFHASFPRRRFSSWVNLAIPWATESRIYRPLFYAQFAVFHLAIFSSFGLSFAIPYAPELPEISLVKGILAALFSLGAGVGCYRVIRRFRNSALRLLSTADDFFSLVFLIVWLSVALALVLAETDKNKGLLLLYSLLTAFLWIYIPFSKNFHFLSYFFTRYHFGKSMSHRGVFPIQRPPQMNPSACSSKEG